MLRCNWPKKTFTRSFLFAPKCCNVDWDPRSLDIKKEALSGLTHYHCISLLPLDDHHYQYYTSGNSSNHGFSSEWGAFCRKAVDKHANTPLSILIIYLNWSTYCNNYWKSKKEMSIQSRRKLTIIIILSKFLAQNNDFPAFWLAP